MSEIPLLTKINALRENLPQWSEKYVRIRPKVGGALVPLTLNHAQMIVHNFLEEIRANNFPVRVAIVKGRKMGVSTYVAARFLHRATLNRGTPVFILAHRRDATDYLFDMVKRMYNNLPDPLKPAVSASNKKELKFGLIDSEYALGSAESDDVGRSMTPLLLHCSEAAFYNNVEDIQTGLVQAVPLAPGSEIIYESTPNGVNNWFYTLCMRGIETQDAGRLKTLFLPWFWMPEYRLKPPVGFSPTPDEQLLMETYGLDKAQVYFRRQKIEDEFNNDLWKFRQEFPMNLMDGFVTSGTSLILSSLVESARKLTITPEPLAPKILGVDGAGSGDRTALVLRQGKKVLKFWVYHKMDDMTLAGIIAKILDTENVDMTFIDVAYGLGAYSRLHELGYGARVQKIHFGERSIEPEIYRNIRAQMAAYVKEWFEEGGCDIPDDNQFVKDMMMMPALEQSGSKGLLTMPAKDKIREANQGISPDIFDGLGLTFARPVSRKISGARVTTDFNYSTKRIGVFSSRRKDKEPETTKSELYVK